MPTEKKSTTTSKSSQGKKNRAAGGRFELKVRSEMENPVISLKLKYQYL
ncbi:MAG: hypothetical protein AABX26_02205 [Nanoarchaeota archaeon]